MPGGKKNPDWAKIPMLPSAKTYGRSGYPDSA